MRRSKHSLSHYQLTTLSMGYLVPVGIFEALPGDTIQQATSALIRCTPLVAPPMHPCHVRIHHWFVPNRIIWDDWEDFITGGPDGMDATDWPHIVLNAGDITPKDLCDHMGVPPNPTSGCSISALPFRAYAMIFNEWYRDQDLAAEAPMSTASGLDTITSATTKKRVAWEKDYFTTARPWEVKGPAITLPLGTEAPVELREGPPTTGVRTFERATGAAHSPIQVFEAGSALSEIDFFADLSSATAVSINVLREALALQRFEEARARYGSRYTEYLRYLGVKSSDARLQRPEYLGGGKQTIQFSEVLSTTVDNTDPTQDSPGRFGGHGIAAMRSNRYRRFFEEHGLVLSLMSVIPKTIYAEGRHKLFRRQTKNDYWQKELEHIGQQGIHMTEVYSDFDDSLGVDSPDHRFGFQDRYDDYRRMESRISGDFRNILAQWHFARSFDPTPPALNGAFVTCTPPETPFADNVDDTLMVMANHSIQARRLVAARGTSSTF